MMTQSSTFDAVRVALVAALFVTAGCTTTNPSTSTTATADPAAERRSIDSNTDAALARLYAQVPNSREMVSRASGVLVFPSVLSGGFVVGGSYGRGELRVAGRPHAYYSLGGASLGWLAGAESKAVFLLFMTPESLQKFEASNGWTVGADASVTVINASADAQVTSQTAQRPIVGYVLTNGGLMANLSIDGTKFTRIQI